MADTVVSLLTRFMDADLRVQTEHAADGEPIVTEHPDTNGSIYSVEFTSDSIGIELEALAFRPKAAQTKTRPSPLLGAPRKGVPLGGPMMWHV